jgi:uncharacterized membrane protein YkvA (DUF1232 family)
MYVCMKKFGGKRVALKMKIYTRDLYEIYFFFLKYRRKRKKEMCIYNISYTLSNTRFIPIIICVNGIDDLSWNGA